MIKGYTFQYQLFDSQNWAHIINTFFNKNNGITKGCGISNTDTNITINDGRFVTYGRLTGVIGTEVITVEATMAGELFARLVYEVDLSKANTITEFNQGIFKVLSSAAEYPVLIQEDLDAGGLVYQMLFAEFKIDQIGIKNFVDKRAFLDFNVAQSQFQAEFDAFMATLAGQGYETPAGAQAKVDTHEGAVDPHSQYALDSALATHEAEMAKFENITASGQYVGEASTEAVATDGALYDLLYLSSAGYNKAQANADTTLPCLSMRVETGTGSRKLLKSGYVRNDAWAWTKGQLLYLSPTTAGLITATKPATTGQRIQIVGYAVAANIIYFNPDYTWIEI